MFGLVSDQSRLMMVNWSRVYSGPLLPEALTQLTLLPGASPQYQQRIVTF